MEKVCVVKMRSACLCLLMLAASPAFAQKVGYKHDNSGNLTDVLNLATDRNNCGDVGVACSSAQLCFDGTCCTQQLCAGACCSSSAVCFNNGCCTPQACNQFATCGTVNNGCGGATQCGAMCSSTDQCVGNLCFPTGTHSHTEENNATGELSIVAGSTFPVEIQGQFVSSKGAFASAMTLSPSPLNGNASWCPINGGTPGCLHDTSTCSVCPADPNAGVGELSCWCINPPPLLYKQIPAGGALSFTSELLIDQDRDGRSDDIRTSQSRIGPPGLGDTQGNVRYHEITSGVWRYEWEDDRKAPDGDYNDYIGQLTFKDCDGEPYTPGVLRWAEAGLFCRDGCNTGTCPDSDRSRPDDLRLTAKVMVDDKKREQDREPRGNLLTLSVVLQSRKVQEIAVCPVIHFRDGLNLKCANGDQSPDFIQQQEYTDSPGSACFSSTVTPGRNGYEPVCTDDKKPACGTFPVSLAREQWYAVNQCQASGPASRVGLGDIVKLGAATDCGAESQLLDFQLALREVDAQLTAASLQARTAAELLDDPLLSVDSVDFWVFDGFPANSTFHCPSGVNVEFASWAEAKSIQVRKYTMFNDVNYRRVDPATYFAKEAR